MDEFGFLRVTVVLILVVGLIVICGWLAKRAGLAGVTGKGTPMRVSSRMSLAARSQIVVLDLEDARLVLGVTPGSINVLHTLPASEQPFTTQATGGSQPLTFQRILQQVKGAKDSAKP